MEPDYINIEYICKEDDKNEYSVYRIGKHHTT